MAQSEYPPAPFDPLYLNSDDQALLMSMTGPPSRPNGPKDDAHGTPDLYSPEFGGAPDSGHFEETPYGEYEGLDDSQFDWNTNGDMIGDLPGGATPGDDEETGEKRKNSFDETKDKMNKKPGRKPLTSEPTTKRKAQNRAAQRAFRERKEKHLHDLESKVDDLEKASEATNHENGLLRAQVERLQTELKEYRKRLSVGGNTTRATPQNTAQGLTSKSQWDLNNNFQFAFPRFLPFGGDPSLGSTRKASQSPSATHTPPANHPRPAASFPTDSTAAFSASNMNELNGLFSPSLLASVSTNTSDDYNFPRPTVQSPASTSMRSKASERANSEINSNSPASSANNGFTSSCVTTPEYSAESPEQRKASEAAVGTLGHDGHRRTSSISHQDFCSEFSKACGNTKNPIPPSVAESNPTPASASSSGELPHTPLQDGLGLDWFANQNGGAFDPVLFGDYRDPQENIMTGDFGGFFQDAFPVTTEFPDAATSPLESTLPKKRDLMKEIEDQQAGKETEVVPGENPKQFLTCNMLWYGPDTSATFEKGPTDVRNRDRVQRSEKVQNGVADMDDLCSQLKAKAKCSGNGAVIDQKDVDDILGPAPGDTQDFFKMFK